MELKGTVDFRVLMGVQVKMEKEVHRERGVIPEREVMMVIHVAKEM